MRLYDGKKVLFVRVRGYIKTDETTYGAWSAVKKVKVK